VSCKRSITAALRIGDSALRSCRSRDLANSFWQVPEGHQHTTVSAMRLSFSGSPACARPHLHRGDTGPLLESAQARSLTPHVIAAATLVMSRCSRPARPRHPPERARPRALAPPPLPCQGRGRPRQGREHPRQGPARRPRARRPQPRPRRRPRQPPRPRRRALPRAAAPTRAAAAAPRRWAGAARRWRRRPTPCWPAGRTGRSRPPMLPAAGLSVTARTETARTEAALLVSHTIPVQNQGSRLRAVPQRHHSAGVGPMAQGWPGCVLARRPWEARNSWHAAQGQPWTRLRAVILQRAARGGRQRAQHAEELERAVPVHDKGARQHRRARARRDAQRRAAPRAAPLSPRQRSPRARSQMRCLT